MSHAWIAVTHLDDEGYATLLALLVLGATPLLAQPGGTLAPVPARGGIIAPLFEGWYANPDGTYTFSFGYFNRNTEEVAEIPVGPNNFIEPAELNGNQPTTFPPGREMGVFAVTVPAEFRNRDVVWTIVYEGRTHKVPGRVGSPAYELGYTPMAMGSMPPALGFQRDGEVGRGPLGTFGPPRAATVGRPLEIEVWVRDDLSVRESGEVPIGITWFKHQGLGAVTFETAAGHADAQGRFTTSATFDAPGEYILRVRADNFSGPDSSPQDQCCWSNGFVLVTVTQ
jgi:hypothetical protein